MLKKFLIGTFALALVLSVGVLTADAFSGATLRVGSKGADVIELQTKLGLTADGSFGPMTKAGVMAFQASNGLTADGVAGPMTLAKMSASVVGGTYPAGCTSNTGFSSTTGQSCAVVTTLPAGCTSTVGFSSTTGQKCDGAVVVGTDNGPLVGGAGDIIITQTSTGVESEVAEGNTENVLGFKVEADDSDLAITNVKLTLVESADNAMSYRLADYVNSVEIYKGSTKLASVDSSDFSKDGTSYSKSVNLTNAIVRDGNKDTFYVKVEAVSNLDSADVGKMWDVTLDSVRFQDATGVIMSEEVTTVTEDFEVTDLASSSDVKLTISKATTSPSIGNVEVSDTSSTDDVKLLEFKLKAAGSDMSFDTLSVVVTPTGATSAQMVDTYFLYNGSEELASTDTTTTGFDLNNDGDELDLDEATAIVATFDLDDTFTIDADDTETFTVKANMLEVDGVNFTQGDSLAVKLLPAGIEVENENSDVVTDESGSAVGSVQSFYYEGAIVTYVSDSFTAENVGDGIDGTIAMKFKVTAFGDNDIVLADDATDLTYVLTGGLETDAVLTSSDLTADAGDFTVTAGDNATFTLSVKFDTTAGFVQLELTHVGTTGVSNVKTAAH